MAGSSRDSDDVIADINITPLVDIILVLLIIFMIAAPSLYQNAIQVNLPDAASGQKAEKTPLNFVITKDGELYWNKEKTEWEKLPAQLKQLDSNLADRTASINADEAARHGNVVKLMDILREAGLFRINITVRSAANSGL